MHTSVDLLKYFRVCEFAGNSFVVVKSVLVFVRLKVGFTSFSGISLM